MAFVRERIDNGDTIEDRFVLHVFRKKHAAARRGGGGYDDGVEDLQNVSRRNLRSGDYFRFRSWGNIEDSRPKADLTGGVNPLMRT